MITNKEELRRYIKADKARMGYKNLFIKWITCSDDFLNCIFMRTLRNYEYYLNIKKGIFDYIPYLWYWWNYRRLKRKSQIFLMPNVADEGLHIVHPGFFRANTYVKIGKNCTVLPMVLFGRKRPDLDNTNIVVGNNVYISTGVTILGPVKIGNNVTIGAGAVVTKDIPDNTVVGGVPAKIIYTKNCDE